MYVHANFQDATYNKNTREEVELFDQPSYIYTCTVYYYYSTCIKFYNIKSIIGC